jgi:hypothetical protein
MARRVVYRRNDEVDEYQELPDAEHLEADLVTVAFPDGSLRSYHVENGLGGVDFESAQAGILVLGFRDSDHLLSAFAPTAWTSVRAPRSATAAADPPTAAEAHRHRPAAACQAQTHHERVDGLPRTQAGPTPDRHQRAASADTTRQGAPCRTNPATRLQQEAADRRSLDLGGRRLDALQPPTRSPCDRAGRHATSGRSHAGAGLRRVSVA